MINTFVKNLKRELIDNRFNYYTNNYDKLRFGPNPEGANILKDFFNFTKNLISKTFPIGKSSNEFAEERIASIDNYIHRLSMLYSYLSDEESRNLLVKLISYRLLGYRKYKLPLNTKEFWNTRKKSRSFIVKSAQSILSPPWKLSLFDLNKLGFAMRLYCVNIQNIFISKQYEYKSSTCERIYVKKHDSVIDAGGCWGDSTLYFSEMAGNGKVYAFEPDNNNLRILDKNLSLNPKLKKKIKVIKKPLWSFSNKKLYLTNSGPGAITSEQNQDNHNMKTSISIDDFVSKYRVPSIDFIKMDIEGAELPALKGAVKTIKKFKPTLAISIYHSFDDFVDIPKYIKTTFPFYNLYLGHYTVYAEETILFAKVS
jgi:FkbM family methyltransferase